MEFDLFIEVPEPAPRRRVIVTPDESLMGETKAEKKHSPSVGESNLKSLGLCKFCQRGEVFLVKLSPKSIENCQALNGELVYTRLCCTYCYNKR